MINTLRDNLNGHPPVGSHLSVAGGISHALRTADRLGCESLAVFSASPRIWKRNPIDPEQLSNWNHTRLTIKISPVVMHAAYLVNPASLDPRIRSLSRMSLRSDLTACEQLGIDWLVLHPGSSPDTDRPNVIRRIAQELDGLFDVCSATKPGIALETTADSRNSIGGQFEDLQEIIAHSRYPERLAVCLDTAHIFAAGYDLTSESGTLRTLDQFHNLAGLDRIRIIHLNDSKSARGSKADRHEHIGLGQIPLSVFRVFLSHPAFQNVPMILETPKDAEGLWDLRNLEILKRLREGHSIPEKLLALPPG